jgi:hypothetical protein
MTSPCPPAQREPALASRRVEGNYVNGVTDCTPHIPDACNPSSTVTPAPFTVCDATLRGLPLVASRSTTRCDRCRRLDPERSHARPSTAAAVIGHRNVTLKKGMCDTSAPGARRFVASYSKDVDE